MKKATPKPLKSQSGNKSASRSKSGISRLKRVFIGGCILIFALLAAATTYAFYASARIVPHTHIAGIDVGGMKKGDVSKLLEAKESAYLNKSLKLSYKGKEWPVTPHELGLTFDNQDAITQAFAVGKTGGFATQVKDLAFALISSRSYEVDLSELSSAARETLTTKVLHEIEVAPAETTLLLTPGKVEVVPGKPGERLDYSAFQTNLYTTFKSNIPDIALSLKTFQPEITTAQAEPARAQADMLLNQPWKLQAGSTNVAVPASEVAGWLVVAVDRDTNNRATGLKLVPKDDTLKASITTFANKANVKPINARLKQVGGALVIDQPEHSGITVDVAQTIEGVKKAIFGSIDATTDRTLPATIKVAQADLRADNIQELGLKELIGTATTDFVGSPSSRAFNINRGQQSLSGSLVKDGEVFSTTGTLGPVEESTGYQTALVIKDNRTVPDAGGGLCQVSTTLFRSVLNAGLPVVSRSAHAYRVGYYELGVGPGLDATVYIPDPDFKWKNDTGHAVYVQSFISGTKLTFELYGTKDGRVSSISTPQILEESPPGDPIYNPTDTMFKDEKKQIETPHPGAKTTVTYTVTRNGQQINKQVFNSTYRPWPAQYLVGTKERPA